jgi:hypothetical protein
MAGHTDARGRTCNERGDGLRRGPLACAGRERAGSILGRAQVGERVETVLGAGSSGTGVQRASPGGGPDPGEVWLLQAEAANLAGCSVSAIRKWRREGSVSSRKITTPGGLERVEVRLGDVLTRAGTRAVVPSAPPAGAQVPQPPVAGTVVVSLADLQTMFERLGVPERRADDVSAQYRSLESEVSFMRGQMARLGTALDERAADRRRVTELERRIARMEAETERLRRQLAAVTRELEKARGMAGAPSMASGAGYGPAPGHGTEPARPVTGPQSPSPAAAPSPTFEGWLEARPPPEKPPPPAGPPIERLAEELRHLYQTLASRPRSPLGAEERAGWSAEVRRYDTVLVRACSRLGVATEHRPGDRLSAPERVALTRALVDAGLDVRSPANVEG